MTSNPLQEYLQLKRELAKLETHLETLKPQVIAHLKPLSKTVQYEGYDFIVSTYTKWKFSDSVMSLQEQLRQAKSREKLAGVATADEKRDILIVREHRDPPPVSGDYVQKARETHPRAYERWTTEEEDLLRSEFGLGRTIAELAAQLHRQEGGIKSRLVTLGLIAK